MNYTGYPLHRENRENDKNKSVRKIPKHRENTGNVVCSSCKLPDSKHERFQYLPRKFPIFLSWISLASQICVLINHKSCKLAQAKFAVGQGKHREFENVI